MLSSSFFWFRGSFFWLSGFTFWCSSFPFNVGLRHPQYVGVVLTILGAAIPMLNDVLIRAGLIQAMLAWASMYVVMCIMEQLNDNDKSDKKS